MYIKKIFKQINENKSVKEYKEQIKPICNLNLRRSSKFNVMAIFGALKTLQNYSYSEDLSIYIASEYGCMEDLMKVLEQINTSESILMPFDFLNVNTNNSGFLISQALNTTGNNINITSYDLSFEKAFFLAFFDLEIGNINDALIGAVDESIENIPNYNSIIHNAQNFSSKDGSSWIYLSNTPNDSIAKVESIEFFNNLNELNLYLEKINYEIVGLNQFAKKYQKELIIDENLIFNTSDNFYGTSSAGELIDIIKEKKSSSIYISLDSKKRSYLFRIISN